MKRAGPYRAVRAALSALLILSVLGISPAVPSASAAGSTFGFNYWPQNHSSSVLFDDHWPTQRPIVAQDLDHMASLGAGVVRLLIFPQASGYMNADVAGSGCTQQPACFNADYGEFKKNLPDLLAMIGERKMKAVVAFGNSYLLYNLWSRDGFYGPNGWLAFQEDSKNWMRGIVDAIQVSGQASHVLFYDYENEVHGAVPRVWEYLQFMYDHAGVPTGKRGISVLHVPQDSNELWNRFHGAGRPFNFVDFHSYTPYSYPPGVINQNIRLAYDGLVAKFPGATILVGEFGTPCSSDRAGYTCPPEDLNNGLVASTEAQQASTLATYIQNARLQGREIPYLLHWMLWDNAPPAANQKTALGYAPHEPKDALGRISEMLNLAINPDMNGVNQRPPGWQVGSTAPASTVLWAGESGSGAADASTGNQYARITVNGAASGLAWIVSDMLPVAGKSKLFVNFYFRTNMPNVKVAVVEYDSNRVEIRRAEGPPASPRGWWTWNSYLHRVGSQSFALHPNTAWVIVSVNAGMSHLEPDILDLDTFSVFAR